MPGSDLPPPAAASLWLPELEALTRGLSHSFSNRIAALGALIELGDTDSAEGRADIRGELKRLHGVNQLLKLLAADPGAAPEAMALGEVVGTALQLQALRLDVRDVPITAELHEQVAIRTSRPMLMRLLIMVLARSARRTEAPGHALHVRVTGGDAEAAVVVSGLPGPGGQELRSGLEPLLATLQARLDDDANAVTLVLPTLQELRRRERGA